MTLIATSVARLDGVALIDLAHAAAREQRVDFVDAVQLGPGTQQFDGEIVGSGGRRHAIGR